MAWNHTRVTECLKIEYPIVLGPMAGGPSTPQLTAAVSNAGGLGSLGAGYLTPEQLRQAIRAIRELTDKPFAVSLFVPDPIRDEAEKIAAVNEAMQKYRDQLGIEKAPELTKYAESFDEQVAVLLEENVSIFSCTFGIPEAHHLQALKDNGVTLIGTATTVREGVELEQAGFDLVVAQGSEAGGHRGTFLNTTQSSMIGTMALVPAMCEYLNIPVLAAGGIMDGRGVAAALMLGAEAAVMGTAFLTCPESGAHIKHKEAIFHSTEVSTTITRAFSGRAARGIVNRFITEMEAQDAIIPSYPIQNALTRDIRKAAAEKYQPQFLSMWAGQGTRLSQSKPAAELFAQVVEQTEARLKRFI